MNKEKNPFFTVMWYKDDGIGASTLSGILQEATHIGTKSYHSIYGEKSENSLEESSQNKAIVTGSGFIFSPDQRYKGYHFYVEDKTHSSEVLTSMNEPPMAPMEELRMDREEGREGGGKEGKTARVFYRQETKGEREIRKRNRESNSYVSMSVSMGVALFSLLVFAAAKNAGMYWHYSVGIPLCLLVLGELPMVLLSLCRIIPWKLGLCANMCAIFKFIAWHRIENSWIWMRGSTKTCCTSMFGYMCFCVYCCWNTNLCRNNAIARWMRRRRQRKNRQNSNHLRKRSRGSKSSKKGKQKGQWQRVVVMDAGMFGDSSNREEVTVMREIFAPASPRDRKMDRESGIMFSIDDDDLPEESDMIELEDLSTTRSDWIESEDKDDKEMV